MGKGIGNKAINGSWRGRPKRRRSHKLVPDTSRHCGGVLSQQRIASPFLRGTEKETESGSESHSVMSNSLQPLGLYSRWNSPGQDTGWVAIPFSRGSSHPRDQTQVSRIAGGFFSSCATREALVSQCPQGSHVTCGGSEIALFPNKVVF